MIRIVDYDAGNLTSVKRALDFLDIPCEITPDCAKIRSAERIIFPGVGHAGASMQVLRERGLERALRDAFEQGTPMLGICLGSQIVLSHSDEGDTTCLGLIDGNCPVFNLHNKSLKVPHMGWDAITVTRQHPLLDNILAGDEFYFVHSFYPQPVQGSRIFATCEYETVFPAAIGERNLFATQFHPEKSGRTGLRILTRFAQWGGTLC
ncbi:MAG: imidazole glycerol phosphate synthase subunit HisH [Chitinivibrionales bacterium]|nr:imidazole glycerol phosphate synthase subunit HisH [Chitinivibrionales bacterium]